MTPSLQTLALCNLSTLELQQARQIFSDGFPVGKLKNIQPLKSPEKSWVIATAILNSTEDSTNTPDPKSIFLHSVTLYLPSSIIITFFNSKRKNYRIKVFQKHDNDQVSHYWSLAYNYQHMFPQDIDAPTNARTWFRFNCPREYPSRRFLTDPF